MKKLRLAIALIAVLLLLSTALPTLAPRAEAQSGSGYDLTWSTFDGGGVTFSTGGTYSLGGTIGQPDAGLQSGGNFSLAGGFWNAFGNGTGINLYLPFIRK